MEDAPQPPALKSQTPLPRVCGFRFSVLDGVVLAACAAATWLLWDDAGLFILLLPYVILHFFVFCNVVRMRRTFELLWAAVFLANACWNQHGQCGLMRLLLAQLPLTVLLIGMELLSKRYHGLGCRRINPAFVDDWIEGRIE